MDWLGMTDSKGRNIAMWDESLFVYTPKEKRNCSNLFLYQQEISMPIRKLKELSSSIMTCAWI